MQCKATVTGTDIQNMSYFVTTAEAEKQAEIRKQELAMLMATAENNSEPSVLNERLLMQYYRDGLNKPRRRKTRSRSRSRSRSGQKRRRSRSRSSRRR